MLLEFDQLRGDPFDIAVENVAPRQAGAHSFRHGNSPRLWMRLKLIPEFRKKDTRTTTREIRTVHPIVSREVQT